MPQKDSIVEQTQTDTDTARNRIYNARLHDTFFVKRITAAGLYDVTYIDTNRHNEFYKDIQKKDDIDISSIYEYVKTPLKKTNTGNFPDKWIELIMYDGKLYVYKPADWYLLNRFIINDSLYISCFSDPNIFLMKSIKHIGKNTYRLIKHRPGDKANPSMDDTTNVYLIDTKRKVYAFETFSSSGPTYCLATPVKNVFAFNLLNTDCNQYKTFGPEGDKVDYKKLLKGIINHE